MSLFQISPLEGPEPPTEIRLFFAGENKTTKGTFTFSDRSAREVVDLWQKRGIKLLGDYEHQSMVNDPPIIAPASCSFDIQVRNGELWAINIKWTKRADAFIRAKEYVYTSAAFDVDAETLEVKRLINFALTNLPAADRIDPLVQARIAAKDYDPEGYGLRAATPIVSPLKATEARVLKAVSYEAAPVVEGAWDAAAAIKRAKTFAGIESNEDLSDPKKQKKFSAFFAYVADDGKTLADYKLPHHDISKNGKFVTSRQGVLAAGNALQGSRGGVSIPAPDLPAVKKHLAQHYHQFDAQAPWEPKKETAMAKFGEKIAEHMDKAEMDSAKLAKAMKMDSEEMDKMLDSEPGEMSSEHAKVLKKMAEHLKVPVEHLCSYAMGHDPDGDEDDDDGDEDDGEDDKKEMKALRATVLTLTGKSDLTEAKAVLMAMKSTHDGASDLAKQVVALSAEIDKLKGVSTQSEFDALVANAKREGKLSPSDIAASKEGTPGGFIAACKAEGEKGVKSLRAFLSALPAKVRLVQSTDRLEPITESSSGLTVEEQDLAARMHIDPKKMLETKARGLKAIR